LFHQYYLLTKPGIIRGNLVSVIAGFFLASQGEIDIGVLLAILAGTSLVIACGCVLNNYLDRGIDKKMERTEKRALATGEISARAAIIYAVVLGTLGTLALVLFTNTLTAVIGLFGLLAYVVIYGYAKRHTVHGTLVGSISGAIPPVAGYTAVANQLDTAALLLFVILVCWQMPHFYAIAIYRLKDYKAAGIPVLPAVRGLRATELQMLFYVAAFTLAASLLTVFGYTSRVYLVVPVVLGAGWIAVWLADKTDTDHWAHRMFSVSLLVLMVLSLAISIDSFFV
jgi:protoheme IX farnesyltransferase